VADVEEAVAAIAAGDLVLIPTDTVYGLACRPDLERSVRALSELKGRTPAQPIALLAASVDALLDRVPELRGHAALALLPGPYTLVLPNPALRFPWLTGERPDTIGVRVPEVTGPAAEILARVVAVAATSANRHGETDPGSLREIADAILQAVAAIVDGGELPGTPSTVLDLTGDEPRVLREGAVPAAEALAHVKGRASARPSGGSQPG
jgi:L-threonylcarbamoyladenylate synthase